MNSVGGSAISEQIQSHQRMVYSVVNPYLRKFPEESREDMLQIANIGLIDAIRSYDASKGCFWAWATLKIRQEIGHYLRREYKLRVKKKIRVVKVAWIDNCFNDAYYDKEIRHSNIRPLFDAVRLLPNTQRQVIVAHYFEGLAIADIALKLNLDKQYVYTTRRKALASLRSKLNQAKWT